MYCTNCGRERKEGSNFCTYCGAKLEEEQKQETPKEKTELMQNSNIEKTKTTNIIPIIIVGTIIGIILFGIAINSIYNDFIKPKNQTTIGERKNKNNSTREKTNTSDWEINYNVPSKFKKESGNSDTLKMYKYDKDGILCSLTIWKITYIKEGETEESIMREYSNSSKKNSIEIKDVNINGKNWKYLEDKDHWSVYEYGMFNSDKTNFYTIKYMDYDSDKDVCKKYLDKFIKSITYNK